MVPISGTPYYEVRGNSIPAVRLYLLELNLLTALSNGFYKIIYISPPENSAVVELIQRNYNLTNQRFQMWSDRLMYGELPFNFFEEFDNH